MELPLSLSLLILLGFRGVPQFTRHDPSFPPLLRAKIPTFWEFKRTILFSCSPQKNSKRQIGFVWNMPTHTSEKEVAGEDELRRNPYEVLGIPSNSTDQEIKSAYRRMALRFNFLIFLKTEWLLMYRVWICSGTIRIRTQMIRLQRICLRKLYLPMMSCLIQRIVVSMIQLLLRLYSYKSWVLILTGWLKIKFTCDVYVGCWSRKWRPWAWSF